MLLIHSETTPGISNIRATYTPPEIVENRHVPVPAMRKLLLEIKNPIKLATTAAKNGDLVVLEMLLDPAPITNEEIIKRRLYRDYQEEHASLSRQFQIRTKQLDVIRKFYYQYGNQILLHIDKVATELDYQVDDVLFNQFRERHREKLRHKKHAFVNDELVQLTTQHRVHLHKKFTAALLVEFKQTEISLNYDDFNEAHGKLYGGLIMDKYNLNAKKTNLTTENEHLLKEIKEIKKNKKTKLTDHRRYCLNVYANLQRTPLFQSLPPEQMRNLPDMSEMKIDIHYVDPDTGNNLIHIAADAGQFEAAYFLIGKGVNPTLKNNRGIAAIDMQDETGETLLHNLVRRRCLQKACELLYLNPLIHIATFTPQKELALSLTVNKQSLLHYLIQKILESTSKTEMEEHKKLLIELAANKFPLSCLLIENNHQQSVFAVMKEHHEQFGTAFIKNLVNHNVTREFNSLFEARINDIMWKQVEDLFYQSPTNWLTKKLQGVFGVSENPIKVQLKFLSQLQERLFEALLTKKDIPLFDFLTANMSCLPVKGVFFELYTNQLQIVANQRKIATTRRLSVEETHFIDATKPDNPIPPRTSSSYLLCFTALPIEGPVESAEEVPSAIGPLTYNDHVGYRSQIAKQNLARNLLELNTVVQKNCPDPLHWFEDHRPKR